MPFLCLRSARVAATFVSAKRTSSLTFIKVTKIARSSAAFRRRAKQKPKRPKSTMAARMTKHIARLQRLLLFFCLEWLHSSTIYVHGYAAWLKCFIDLDDTEVIMNYDVVPVEQSPHVVRVQVKPQQDNDSDSSSSSWTTEPFNYPAHMETRVSLSLKVPEALTRYDVQYVVETSPGATFTTRRMCEGRRSHGHGYDQETTLVIDGSEAMVAVWAGWATGHEPVYLTEKLVFRRVGGTEL